MKRQLVLVTVVLALFLALAGFLAGGDALFGTDEALSPESNDMPVPGQDDVEEAIIEDGEQGEVNLGMPVPGSEGVPEMIVEEVDEGEETGAASSGMPVPGLDGVQEMIVTEE